VCREVVVDASSDDFYKHIMYNNYGEVGLSVKDMVDKFAAASAQHKQVRPRGRAQRWGGGNRLLIGSYYPARQPCHTSSPPVGLRAAQSMPNTFEGCLCYVCSHRLPAWPLPPFR
jgi:hypothetical protein